MQAASRVSLSLARQNVLPRPVVLAAGQSRNFSWLPWEEQPRRQCELKMQTLDHLPPRHPFIPENSGPFGRFPHSPQEIIRRWQISRKDPTVDFNGLEICSTIAFYLIVGFIANRIYKGIKGAIEKNKELSAKAEEAVVKYKEALLTQKFPPKK